MNWIAQAPSNIALIKYMGKLDHERNIPINSSLSYTLTDLISAVMLEEITEPKDYWEPLDIPGFISAFDLPESGKTRFLKHLAAIKQRFGYDGSFVVRSCNNFPESTGLASSASSFAALTMCAVRALCDLTQQEEPALSEIATLSQMGSGSSCRSFFTPWALWTQAEVKTIDLPYPKLLHQVVIVNHAPKAISSREAHRRIESSPLFISRDERANDNLNDLLDAFTNKDWARAYQVAWREFWDMHQLFHTAKPAFSYMTEESKQVLNIIAEHWEQQGDGPIVTMDAGPNIHLLYRPDQCELARHLKQEHFIGNFDVI